MTFVDLFSKFYPFYVIIFIGYFAGRYLNTDRTSIAKLLFNIIVPIIFVDFALKLKLNASYFILPVLLFGISILMNLLYYRVSKSIWPSDSKANVIGFSAGTGNTGYFGLPVAIALFDAETVAIYMLMNIGLSFYDYTLGAFTIARGKMDRKSALMSVAKLPMLYAFLFGIMLNYLSISVPDGFFEIAGFARGCYVFLGMMLIGLALANIKAYTFDKKFIAVMLSAKYLSYPAFGILFVMIDKLFFNMFSDSIHLAFMLITIVPPAANTVVFASIHHAHPEEAASAVLIGTLLSAVYMPLVIGLMF